MSTLGVVNSQIVNEEAITAVSKMVEEDIFISSNYWDTFHTAQKMIEEDCDYIILFYDPKDDESRRLLRLCVVSKTPFFCIIVKKEKDENGRFQENVKEQKNRSVRRHSDKSRGFLSRFKRK